MKKILLFLLVLILVSCTAPTAPASTPTGIVRLTETLTPVSTDAPTETPTRVIPSRTPTLDLAHLPTRTSQPAATCPTSDKKARLALGTAFKDKKALYHDVRTVVLKYLNEGGDPQAAMEKLAERSIFVSLLDLTHDGVLEFILPSGYLTVFGCENGKYVNLLDIPPSNRSMTAVPLIVQDLNRNGLMELLIGQVQRSDLATYQILEWDGKQFASLVTDEFLSNEANLYIKDRVIYAVGQSNAEQGALQGNWEVVDTDGNGLKDVVIRAGVYDSPISSSSLEDRLTLRWNGRVYAVGRLSKEATPTSTPSPTPLPFSATCSIKVPELRFERPELVNPTQAILEYLNAGGMPEKLDSMMLDVTIKDLNNDTAPEIIVIDSYAIASFRMFTCQNGKYQEAVTSQSGFVASFLEILAIKDNNKNGYPEVFLKGIGCIAWRCGDLYVMEWDGDRFVQKLRDIDFSGRPIEFADMDEPKDASLKDLDGDGIAELVWTGEVIPDWHGDHWIFYPQRLATHVFKWDGSNYTAQPVEYASPQFRFQAVQDGDRYAKAGRYEKALESYQLAITSDSLKWWTENLHNYTMAPHGLGPCAGDVSACPHPAEDPSERPVLSAYARFKQMVVHLLLGDVARAESHYQELLSARDPETLDYKIAGMATAFWTEYQLTQDIATSCARAVSYIKVSPSVLAYLTGSANSQAIGYLASPEEVCPFK